jgi:hypothetical protein
MWDKDNIHVYIGLEREEEFLIFLMWENYIIGFWYFSNSTKDYLKSISHSPKIGFRRYSISCDSIHVGEHFSNKVLIKKERKMDFTYN